MRSLTEVAQQSNGGIAADKEILGMDIERMEREREIARSMYPNSVNERFRYWSKQFDPNKLSPEGLKHYWKTYLNMAPGGESQARSSFNYQLRMRLATAPTASAREFIAREMHSVAPEFAKQDINPVLAELAAANANANIAKVGVAYSNDLDARLKAYLENRTLDPDVPVNAHVSDFIKAERANVLDKTDVVDGRLVFKGPNGEGALFEGMPDVPAPTGAEQVAIHNLSMDAISKRVEENVFHTRKIVSEQEKQTRAEARSMLESGTHPVDRWVDLFAMLPGSDTTANIQAGLKGEIASGRIKTDKELAQTVFKAFALHGKKDS